jgi:hypothetical protein
LKKDVLSRGEKGALVRARCLLHWTAGESHRALGVRFRGLGAAPSRVQALGRNAAWLLETLANAAEREGVDPERVAFVRELALEARHGLPAPLAPLARLQAPGITRDHLQGLYHTKRDVQLHDPEVILDADPELFEGLLTPLQLARLKQAILADLEETLQRRRAGHAARAEQAELPLRIVDDLYSATGGGLEQAVADALEHVGLSAQRVLRQPHGEEDVRVAHPDGTVVISVTASQGDARPVKWNKVKEVLGAGIGQNPTNYVCVARPGFDSLAERNVAGIAREPERRLLLVPVTVLAEAVVRCSEGRMTSAELGNLLARERGQLSIEQLLGAEPATEPAEPTSVTP